jgi:hypothetical protein
LLPEKVKAHLGLDAKASWVILPELNVVAWPGRDIYPVPGRPKEYQYGFLPPILFDQIKGAIQALDKKERREMVRTD